MLDCILEASADDRREMKESKCVAATVLPTLGVDRLALYVVVNGVHEISIFGAQPPGIQMVQSRLESGPRARRTLQTEWGLSLDLTSIKDTGPNDLRSQYGNLRACRYSLFSSDSK